jgi:hypothetical protein
MEVSKSALPLVALEKKKISYSHHESNPDAW